MGGQGVPDQLVMIGQDLRVPITEALQHRSGALDVGEQEGEGLRGRCRTAPPLVLAIPAGEIVWAAGLPGRHSSCSKVCPNSASHVLRTAAATSLGTRASNTT